MLLSFFHTCASKQHHNLHDRESFVLSLSYTNGNFSLQNLACIFQQWASSSALGLREQGSWMHTHQFLLLSFHILIALGHPMHGNPYSVTFLSILAHLHTPFIRPVGVRLSPPFLSSPQPPFYSTYSAISMAHAHVLRED